MRKIQLLLLLMASTLETAFSQTTIQPGNVSGTWTKAGSPYRINGDVVIPKDSTLTIEPGVVVSFIDKYGIKVDGVIKAVGTENERITFKPENYSVGWKGMLFLENPDTSAFTYCNIEDCENDAYYENGNPVKIDGRYILYSGIGAYNSELIQIENCVFISNLRSINIRGGSVQIFGCTFEDHGDNGTKEEDAIIIDSAQASIDSCFFVNNYADGFFSLVVISMSEWTNLEKSIITRCVFMNNKFCNLGLSGRNVIVDSCKFLYNEHTQGGAITCAGFSGTISNCYFEGNHVSAYGDAIELIKNCNGALIQNCRFINNGSQTKVAILYREGQGSTIVSNCYFEGNTGCIGGADNGSTFTVVNCEFRNNRRPVDLNSNSIMINCNITNNRSFIQNTQGKELDHFSGLSVEGTPKIYNTIIWGNNDSSNNKTQVYFKYPTSNPGFYNCIIEGDSAGFQKGLNNDFAFTGDYVNCYSQIPQWIDTAGGNWQLKNDCSGSAYPYNKGYIGSAIDAYKKYLVTDIDGNPRWGDDTLDIGAYEIGPLKSKFKVLSSPENAEICLGEDVSFAFDYNGEGVVYDWQYSTDNGQNWSVHSLVNPLVINNPALSDSNTWYRARLVNQCGFRDTVGPVRLIVHNNPTVDLGPDLNMPDDSTITLHGPKGLSTYLWSDNSGLDSLFLDGSILGPGNFTFWLQVANTFNCTDRDTIVVEVVKTGSVINQVLRNVVIYPNPATERIHVPVKYNRVTIFDLTGRLVKSGVNANGSIDVSDLQEGMYRILLESGDQESGAATLVVRSVD